MMQEIIESWLKENYLYKVTSSSLGFVYVSINHMEKSGVEIHFGGDDMWIMLDVPSEDGYNPSYELVTKTVHYSDPDMFQKLRNTISYAEECKAILVR
jgi:hypothetical protein